MPIAVSCPCGARLKIRDEAAGKTLKCPKCQAPLRVPEPEPDPGPEIRIVDEPAAPVAAAAPRERPGPPRVPRSPVYRAGLRSGKKVAWEVYVVAGLIALGLLAGVMQMSKGNGSVVGLGLNALMLVGLVKRENWGWWLTVVLSGLSIAVCCWLAGVVAKQLEGAADLLYGLAAVHGGVIVLLIVCRARGAYLQ